MDPKSPVPSRRQSMKSLFKTLLVVLVFRSFVAEAYSIPSGSMIPTLQVGDHIYVNKIVYGLRIPLWGKKFFTRSPARGEVVVFVHPKSSDNLIKRVIAVAGDSVELRDGMVWVNGAAVPSSHVTDDCHYTDYDEASGQWYRGDCVQWQETLDGRSFTTLRLPERSSSSMPAVQVPAGTIFVLGDNRDNSNDSRYWGFVPLDHVKGRAMFVWWSSGGPDGVRWPRFFTALR